MPCSIHNIFERYIVFCRDSGYSLPLFLCHHQLANIQPFLTQLLQGSAAQHLTLRTQQTNYYEWPRERSMVLCHWDILTHKMLSFIVGTDTISLGYVNLLGVTETLWRLWRTAWCLEIFSQNLKVRSIESRSGQRKNITSRLPENNRNSFVDLQSKTQKDSNRNRPKRNFILWNSEMLYFD